MDPLWGLVLDPVRELRFKGPYDDYVTVSLTIRNSAATKIAFKVLTTAVERYKFKPNSGILEPDQIMETKGMLHIFLFILSLKLK